MSDLFDLQLPGSKHRQTTLNNVIHRQIHRKTP